MMGSFTAWETYTIMRWFLLAGCIAPFVLAYIIARGHELSWRPGEVTMIVGMVMFALIVLNGIILGRPGSNIDISLEIGYFVGLLGAFLICVGGFRRQAENVRAKPPGI
jgi:Flp pilus assembly protein protease CpaA